MPTLKQHILESLSDDAKAYVQDFEALSHEQLAVSPGGSARTGYDITYEVVLVNERISQRLASIDPGKWPYEGWVVAPPEAQNKEELMKRFKSSIDAIAKSIEALDDELSGGYVADGKEQSFSGIAGMAVWHMGYHGGQLNYIQSLHGDMELHWD